ncbi:lamin tail domain-containing protein [Echinicola shivajiensis]|uniref:lamin tail domain-containing protein n=1 Tax=Echinicola shivajiensis TaxID=1035916 RepID=UPI001BFC5E9A|nr:lamin tail domain-containing protein [Echinicola shivajiensis]
MKYFLKTWGMSTWILFILFSIIYPFTDVAKQQLVAHPYTSIFRGASYGKSLTNNIENPKISLKHQTNLLSFPPAHQKLLTVSQYIQNLKNKPNPKKVEFQIINRPKTACEIKPNIARGTNKDTIPPKVLHVSQKSEYELLIHFSKPMDSTFAIIPHYYRLNGKHPKALSWGKKANQILLVMQATPLKTDADNLLKISNVMDHSGNKIIPIEYYFSLRKNSQPIFKDIIINEIMAAPKKDNPLPNTEYIELFNTSDSSWELGGFILANKSREAILPSYSIGPSEYVLLVHEDDQELFDHLDNVLGLSSWPRFVNGEDKVLLMDIEENPLDSLSYSSSSYGSSSKANGGYSLEVVNPFYSCDQTTLLRASESPLLGTPGKENSVFDPTPDQIKPKLLKAIVINPNTIILEFDEALKPNLDNAVWQFTPNMEIKNVDFHPSSLNKISISFEESLKEKKAYQIMVEGLRDCSGNLIAPLKNQASFQIPSIAEKGEIILNEVLFNPRSGTPKFIEIYNYSSKFIDISNWKLANYNDETISNRKTIIEETEIIAPFDFRVITTAIDILHQEYPKGKKENWIEISTLPSFPIAEGTVILLNPDETLVERFDYSDKFHHEMIQNTKGVSLERFSSEHETNEPENWHSASASHGYATPGYKNSQNYEKSLSGIGLEVNPKTFLPEATGEQPFTTISYQLAKPGYVGTIRIFGTNGLLIKSLCENDIWGISGFYTWNGTDQNGNKVRPGYYIVLAEMLNLDGSIMQIKKTVVVGSKF